MTRSLMRSLRETAAGFTRRDFFKTGSLLALPALFGRRSSASAAQTSLLPVAQPPSTAGALQIGPNIYQSIGVRPFISGTGTLTVNGGSLELPEVQAAQAEAARHMVQLDELTEAVGRRLAAITGAEFGIVTAGCAAAMTHAAAACIAGGNPDKHVHLPAIDGLDKSEILIPKQARNNYDAALRATGARLIEVNSPEELEAAIGPSTAMIYVRSEVPGAPLPNEEVYRIAKQKNVPTLVDAAPEVLTIPNVHLQAGATMVCYSGGKQLRGPQCSGLLLGRKDLVRAAWVHSAPHHGFSRSMKVGKEEIMGLLAAVEVWARQDHTTRWQGLLDKLDVIAKRMATIPGVATQVRETSAEQLSNRSPSLSVSWDPAALGITGSDVARILDATDPRVLVGGGGGRGGATPAPNTTNISVTAFNLGPGEERIVADRLHAVLSATHTLKPAESPKPPVADLTGEWEVQIQFEASAGTHVLTLIQQGNQVQGTHRGEFVSRPLTGTINGESVQLRSSLGERAIGNALSYAFTGLLEDGRMAGDLDMGEYLKAKWTARRKG